MRGAPAALPPAGLPGLDPSWSRLVPFRDADGVERTVHLLDGADAVRGATGAEPVGVLLAVHGNPTWSYLWRSLLPAAAAAGWRLVAPDQLDMGFSERTGTRRRLERRVDDLGRLTDALGITGPGAAPTRVVAAGHDWGGVVTSGWAGTHREVLAGLVLLNTAVHQPEDAPLPPILVPFTSRGLHHLGTVDTKAFLRATTATARRPLAPGVAKAYLAPYSGASRRVGIGAFVADIPAEASHPSRPALDAVAAGVSRIGADGVPSLLVWGPADPVFRQRYLHDLRARLPRGDVQRFEGSGHLVVEDSDVAGTVTRWLRQLPAGPAAADGPHAVPGGAPGGAPGAATERPPLWSALAARADDDAVAVVQLRPGAPAQTTTWRELAARVEDLAEGLAASGVRPGDRVALLVPPGPDLSALFSACLRLGAVVVVADAGLGVKGLTRAVASAGPVVVIGIERALLAARVLGWPGRRVLAGPASGGARGAVLGDVERLAEVEQRGRARRRAAGHAPLPEPSPDAQGAVLFTSGSTGPAKGVVHTHATLQALRDAAASTCGIGPGGSLVAAFAPFAILAPLLGATCSVPETDVTKPDTLTAAALSAAVAAVVGGAGDGRDRPVVFASPAALRRVVATADDLDDAGRAALAQVRLLLCAGAPVSTELLAAAAEVLPAAEARTPYGMTEGLLVAQTNLTERQAAGPGEGVLVGSPLPGTRVAVSALDERGRATGTPVEGAEGPTGELVVRSPLMKDHYDQLWDVQRESVRDTPGEPGWHRTGDVGHLDAAGRVWVEGRLAHVLTTAAGPLTPVGAEQRAETLDAVVRAAVVGVGPVGTQQPVVVVEAAAGGPLPGPAPVALVDAVRAVAGLPVPVAAVLVVAELPTDVRHRSKVDRARVAAWAGEVLAGRTRAGRTPW